MDSNKLIVPFIRTLGVQHLSVLEMTRGKFPKLQKLKSITLSCSKVLRAKLSLESYYRYQQSRTISKFWALSVMVILSLPVPNELQNVPSLF